MEFSEKLIKGEIKANYKNIILDVQLSDDGIVKVFCPDVGGGYDLYAVGAKVWISHNKDKRRRIKYEVQLVNKGEGLAFVNPNYNEMLFAEALKADVIEDFREYDKIRRIHPGDALKYAHFELSGKEGNKLYLYVVSICRKEGARVVFPSNLNFMEMNVLEEFRGLRAKGFETAILLIVSRGDCLEAKFSWAIDPIAAAKIYDEAKNGLKFLCYGCKVSQSNVVIDRKMPILY